VRRCLIEGYLLSITRIAIDLLNTVKIERDRDLLNTVEI
jgi:hypothetical protein